MSVSAEFRAYIMDQLEGLDGLQIRSMFGGAGIYAQDVMFALIADDMLYFKVDERNRADYHIEGSRPFSYERKGKRIALSSYLQVPERLFDDPDEMLAWAQKALGAARREKRLKSGAS